MKSYSVRRCFNKSFVAKINALGIAGLWALAVVSCEAQSQTISGDLSVQGTIDATGNTVQFGTVSGANSPGVAFTYGDGTNGMVGFSASRPQSGWLWRSNIGSWKPQMELDGNNRLLLFDLNTTPAAGITLDPTGTSTFTSSLTVNGANNLMPNQTLTGAGSVLTQGLADSRYLLQGQAISGSLITGGNVVYNNASNVLNHDQTIKNGMLFFGNDDSSANNSVRASIGYVPGWGELSLDLQGSPQNAIAIGKGDATGYGAPYIYVGSEADTQQMHLMSAGIIGLDAPYLYFGPNNGGPSSSYFSGGIDVGGYDAHDGLTVRGDVRVYNANSMGIYSDTGSTSMGGGWFGSDAWNVNNDIGGLSVSAWAAGGFSSSRSNFAVILGNPHNTVREVDLFGAVDDWSGGTAAVGKIRLGSYNFSPMDVYMSPRTRDVAKFTETSGIYLGLDSGNRVVVGNAADDGTNMLQVQGAAKVSGTLTADRLVVAHIDPQGDLSMGEFTAGQ